MTDRKWREHLSAEHRAFEYVTRPSELNHVSRVIEASLAFSSDAGTG